VMKQVLPKLNNDATIAAMATPMNQVEEEEEEEHPYEVSQRETGEKVAAATPLPKPKRKTKTCAMCGKSGHDRRTCSERTNVPPPLPLAVAPLAVRPAVNKDDSDVESVTSSADDSDSSDDEVDTPAVVTSPNNLEPPLTASFPEQFQCEEEDGWEHCDCDELPFTLNAKGDRVYDVDGERPEFDASESGLKDIPRKTSTAMDFFVMLLTLIGLQTFVASTNMNAVHLKRKKGWSKPLIVEEFLAYIGLILYFGMIDSPSDRETFRENSIFYLPFVSQVMNASRFEAITAMWKWDASVTFCIACITAWKPLTRATVTRIS
jgi:hypothetical protein